MHPDYKLNSLDRHRPRSFANCTPILDRTLLKLVCGLKLVYIFVFILIPSLSFRQSLFLINLFRVLNRHILQIDLTFSRG